MTVLPAPDEGEPLATASDRPPLRLAPPAEPRRLSRWLFRAGRVGGLLVLAVAALGASFATNYQPLRTDPGGVSGAAGETVSKRGDFYSPGGSPFAAYTVAVREGTTFVFWFTLKNRGPVGVTLSRIGPGPGQNRGFPVVQTQVDPAPGRHGPGRFRPMSLPAGDTRELRLTIRVTHCLPSGQAVTFAQVPVEFHLLGLTRHTTVDLPETITLTPAVGTAC